MKAATWRTKGKEWWQDQMTSGKVFMLVSAALVLGLASVLVLIPLDPYLVTFGIADGYSYPIIAFNAAAGLGTTYDGVTITNGFQPLWMWMHLPWMVGAESALDRLAVVRVMWVVTALAAVFVWGRLLLRAGINRLALAVFVILMAGFGWSLFVLYSGLETPLVLLFIGINFLMLDKLEARERVGVWGGVVMGVVMGLTLLARLDSIFVLVPVGFVLLVRLVKTRQWVGLAGCVVGGSLTTLPYLAGNLFNFGSIMPVSGLVKTRAHIDLGETMGVLGGWVERLDRILPTGGWLLLVVVAGIAMVAGGWAVRDMVRRRETRMLRVVVILLVASGGQYLYYLLKMTEINVAWHLYIQFITLYVILAVAIHCLQRVPVLEKRVFKLFGGRAVIYVLCLGGIAVGTLYYGQVKAVNRPTNWGNISMGNWIGEHLPAGARLATDDTFMLALYAPKVHFIDLNGLVGDQELAAMVLRREYAAILTRWEVDYAIARLPEGCVPYPAETVLHEEALNNAKNQVMVLVEAGTYLENLAETDLIGNDCH